MIKEGGSNIKDESQMMQEIGKMAVRASTPPTKQAS